MTATHRRGHPLDALTVDEIATAIERLRSAGVAGDATTFHRVALHDPTDDEVRAFEAGEQVPRRVEVVLWHRDRRIVERTVVSLAPGADPAAAVLTKEEVPGARPVPGLLELAVAGEIALADERVVAALAARGITDLGKVQVDPWPTGSFGLECEEGKRVSRCVLFYREQPSDNGYSRPIDGLAVHVDHDAGVVVHVDDVGTWPVPERTDNYDAASVGPLRDDLRPIEITQPEGASFTVEGNEVRWQRWRFRVWLDPTEGIVIGALTYRDGDRERSILRRASLSEMVVPYGDTRSTISFRNALDAGELGLGRFANSLTLGCDCVGEISYLDAAMCFDSGDPYVIEHAVCIHEEDFGILWKHSDLHTLTTEVRRSRRLVVSSVFTAGNYEYGFFWHLYMDGTIELQVKLTGIVSPMAYAEGDDLNHATRVAPQVAAPAHQHLFCFRLDMAVDGVENTVVEVDVDPAPAGPANPLGNAFGPTVTRLETSAGAVRDGAPSRSRRWRVINERVTNPLGQPTAYELVPGPLPDFLPGPGSVIAGRVGFAKHQVWVTPSSPEQRFAAGEFPTQSLPGEGLPAWAAADEPVADTDLTLWHTFGVTHVVRPEDYPVMPVEYIGFSLRPFGFFDRNPALDVPPSAHGEPA